MKFVHLSDLHLGKRLKEYSLLEDQRYILDRIIEFVQAEKPDAVVIAGDIYDTAVPSAEAVTLCDSFLTKLHECQTKVMVISGNHDNARRVAFGSELLHKSDVYMSPVYDGKMSCVTLQDDNGPVNFYLMPFLRIGEIKRCHPDTNIETYTEAIQTVVEAAGINWAERNVVVSHQFVTGGQVSCKPASDEPEDVGVAKGNTSNADQVNGDKATGDAADMPIRADEERIGGLDLVSRQAYDGFEYVALGHLHTPQHVGIPTVRYCGTPLKYSLSEIWVDKSVTVVEMGAKGSEVQIHTVPLVPQHDTRQIKGKLRELRDYEFDKGNHEDYISVVLTDEETQIDAIGKLRRVYPNILSISYLKQVWTGSALSSCKVKELNPAEVFAEFYKERTGKAMSAEQEKLVAKILEGIQVQENAR